ncbi:MAG: dephospho-CoA kinase [Lachnospiraceae bacterium]|nr:dephospho-CoA kinase [Lachnospiraceae bacterium]
MKKIGITGGVGSGKSEVLKFLRQEYGAIVLEADAIGHEQMEPGTRGFAEIVEVFGSEILAEDGTIDRKALGAIVFTDPEQLARLNGIIHPNVASVIKERMAAAEDDGCEMVVVEAAILIESGLDSLVDELWYIYVEPEVRITRLMASRGYTRQKCLDIMGNQMTEAEYRKACHVVINNSDSWEETANAIREHCQRQQR